MGQFVGLPEGESSILQVVVYEAANSHVHAFCACTVRGFNIDYV